jgi:hypothetical protein
MLWQPCSVGVLVRESWHNSHAGRRLPAPTHTAAAAPPPAQPGSEETRSRFVPPCPCTQQTAPTKSSRECSPSSQAAPTHECRAPQAMPQRNSMCRRAAPDSCKAILSLTPAAAHARHTTRPLHMTLTPSLPGTYVHKANGRPYASAPPPCVTWQVTIAGTIRPVNDSPPHASPCLTAYKSHHQCHTPTPRPAQPLATLMPPHASAHAARCAWAAAAAAAAAAVSSKLRGEKPGLAAIGRHTHIQGFPP